MRRKIFNLLLILSVTILLIAFLRYVIKKDTMQTQQTRLNFFTENLSIQKNNILGSFSKSASLMFSVMAGDSLIINLLNSTPEADSLKFEKIKSELNKHALPYLNNLKKVGFSSLTFMLKNSGLYYNFNTENGHCELCKPEQILMLQNNFDVIPLTGTSICKNQIGYNYVYPVLSDKNEKHSAFVEIGIDFQLFKKMLTENLPRNNVGFLIYVSNQVSADSIKVNYQTCFWEINENVTTQKNLEQITGLNLHEKDRNKIISLLENASKNNTDDNSSIYLHSSKNPKALSFSELNYFGSNRKIFLFSSCTDQILDKTKEWNDQIFIINLIILLLAMFGIIYLYINRVNILNEKRNIEHSELKLKELNQSKDKFFSILAHDLKNPFNGIMGMSGYLNESYYRIDDAEKKEIINDINISSKNAFNLLQNLLEWTRTQSGQIKNSPVKIEPKNIIDLSLETVSKIAKNKEIEIIQLFETNLNGYADENLVSTVLRNLFTNAVKFSARKSKVEVIVKQFNNELVFCVKDAGIGLKNEEIDQLFRIDVNFHKRGTEDETGTGLGLKICKEFVEYCHGRIWVVSEPKVGSSFFFTIPIYK